jgi:3-ketosteroid 9alpha-monooxygenase subunit A
MTRSFPFHPFPSGWYQVAYVEDVPAGHVQALHYFGRDLVLFRTEGGVLRVLDAHCVHLGAHLGVGGKVVGESLRCPFHAWRWGVDGACVEVPYSDRPPAAARMRAWPVREVNGLVMVFHDETGVAPGWEVPVVSEVGHDEWTPFEKRRWKIRTQPQEMAENAVDRAHFRYVHGTLTVPESEAEADGPVLRVRSKMKLATPMGEMDGAIESDAWGFGFGVVRFQGIVETVLLSSVVPIDGEHVDVWFSFSVKKLPSRGATRGVGAALVADIEKQLAEDTPIWENKAHLTAPALCPDDGPIGLLRRWAKQFYPG